MKKVYFGKLLPLLMLIALNGLSCQKKTRTVDAPEPEKHLSTGVSVMAMSTSLKVMTYNIHAGIGTDGVLNLQRIADVIRNSNADVIGLNEVDKNYDARSNYVDQAAWLASELGMHYVFQKTTWKAANAASGNLPREFGHMVLSKYPIEDFSKWIFTAFDTHYRGLLETRININGNTFHFYMTHLGTDVADHASQVQELLSYTSRRAGPKLVAGDFNFIPTDAQHAVMDGPYNDPFGTALQPYTFKATSPTKRLDYLWGTSHVQFSNTDTISTQAADHFPLVSDVTLDFSSLTFLQFNMNHGEGADGVLNLQRVADMIRNSGADVVALNEIDRNYDPRSNYVDQLAWLANELHMNYEFQKTTWKAAIPASGNLPREFGHGVLSKYPVGGSTSERWLYTEYDTHYRGLLKARVNVCGNPMYLYVTHLGTDAADRLSQAQELMGFFNLGNHTWKVLAGSFNDTPGSAPINTITTSLSDVFAGQQAYTYPTVLPNVRVEYIFLKNTVQATNDTVLSSQASTHLPVRCRLKLL
jgi:endonuclease/exonuclease/phosphatase family metal-dependent hydrolase